MRYIAIILLSIFTVISLGCSGSGNRRPNTTPTIPTTEPPSAAANITTEAGILQVIAYNCEPDLGRITSEINTTTRIARRQRPSAFLGQPLLGFEIHARTPEASRQRCHGSEACFERFGHLGRLHVWCSGGGVEHESAHALAWAVRLSCWRTVYHNDVNFKCG